MLQAFRIKTTEREKGEREKKKKRGNRSANGVCHHSWMTAPVARCLIFAQSTTAELYARGTRDINIDQAIEIERPRAKSRVRVRSFGRVQRDAGVSRALLVLPVSFFLRLLLFYFISPFVSSRGAASKSSRWRVNEDTFVPAKIWPCLSAPRSPRRPDTFRRFNYAPAVAKIKTRGSHFVLFGILPLSFSLSFSPSFPLFLLLSLARAVNSPFITEDKLEWRFSLSSEFQV